MIELEEKIWFITLGIIPIILLFFLLLQFWKQRTQQKFATKPLLKKLAPNKSLFKPILKTLLLCLAFLFITIALVNPKIGTKIETIKREGVDIVFAIDVSKSMLAEDIAPNRLEKSKRIVSEIINQLASDRIGIIAYAAQAAPQLPITTDYATAKMFLQSMNTDMLSSQGTAIDEAIQLAKTYYNDDDQTNRILFIISDGEDHSNNAIDVVKAATNQGIKTYTIGVGTPKGAPIPIKRNGIIQTYKKDNKGDVVITKRNEKILENIASKGNGIYIDGSNTEKVIEIVKETLNEMDKKEFETKKFAAFKDQFQWFLGFAIFLFFLDIFLLERKTEWLQKLNLFNENN